MMIDTIFCTANLQAESWQDSIRKAAAPLLQENCIEERYIDNMIQSVLKYGPYIVIDKGIALAHARPEDGVRKTALTLVTLDPAVSFGSENDPVRIMIVLAASGDDEHVNLLAFLADFLNNEDNIKNLLSAVDNTQLKKIIRGA